MNAKNTAATELQAALERPVYNRTLDREVGRGDLDYEVYLRTSELLTLQTPAHGLVVPDEMLFQILHQTQELWLKALAFEAVSLVDALDEGAAFRAIGALDRMISITEALRRDLEVLFTLAPEIFQVIRRSLGNGSGLESPGYNRLQVAASAVGEAFHRWRERRGVELLAVYAGAPANLDLHGVAEKLVDWDGSFQSWLMAHFLLVRRTIGVDRRVKALDGFPTQVLAARMTRPLFPELWDLRVEMTGRWSREGGFAPGEKRPSTSGEFPAAEPSSAGRRESR